ncbi:hypothetical protein KSD_68250 [Ktedonobacter sp. SOSP1-85]|nr:hypothetical protein KSD_68250 [Ktedonobacter sp. SOSP1-85]
MHARRLPVGTILNGHFCKHSWVGDGFIFLNSHTTPHYTKREAAMRESWHIYEVAPLGPLGFGGQWDEAVCRTAEIIRYVGSAGGHLQRDAPWIETRVTHVQVARWNKSYKR